MISRANSLTHGLCASVCVPEDAALVLQRADDFFNTLKPQNDLQCWVAIEVAVASIRVDRCARIERRTRDKIALRAELFWDDDKKLEASLLGEQLAGRPEIVLEQLRRTPQGCEWLMGRWAMLAHSADAKGVWTPAQNQLAFDLLGTPIELREGHQPGASLDFQGKLIEPLGSPAEVARREIAELERRRDEVAVMDEVNRTLAINDHGDDNDPELRRIRRYEAAAHSKLRWCLKELRTPSPHQMPARGLRPRWLGTDRLLKSESTDRPAPAAPEPEPAPQPVPPPSPQPALLPELKIEEPEEPVERGWFESLHPPFDLTPDEYPAVGEEVDIPKIIASRREKKLKKAQNRREAERRKLEKLRA